MPETGRTYVWVEMSETWVDVSPKEKDLVTFIKIVKEEKDD
jgi:hypothetical protein